MKASTTESLDIEAIRSDFPILQREVNETPLVYLDNAATSQTPEPVVETIAGYYRHTNSNVERGIHQLSQEASIAYEEAHDRVAEFIGATGGREEVIFTKNTTESINIVAAAWGLEALGPDDEIVTTQMEHHSSLVTFQQLAERTGATIKFVEIDDDGYLDMDHARECITDDTKLVSVVHASNTLGTINPVAEISEIAHNHGALVLVDGAQSAPHQPIDVEAIDADFFAFSGHKMCGPTGIGVLYGKRELLESMQPYLYGGGMVRKVTYEETTFEELPWKFEAGTPVIAQGIALAKACDYLDAIGMERIEAHGQELTAYAHDRLSSFDDIEIYGPPADDRAGLVSFNVDGVHAHDLSSIVNDHGVAIRAGDHCTQPLHDTLGIAASARASFYLYNTREEVDVLIEAIDDARQLFA
ncbi:aminotransferase class V-fold PLP-dependent enzyme [Halocatena halophila]|uniref:aminotransferase class V-fold PLP-dependent enzyme n=1 Tax=Halocatena halophila TaxID=2814576 RepID=UPI002ED2A3A1